MQWGMNKATTPYQFGANINGTWSNLGTVSASGEWALSPSTLNITGPITFNSAATFNAAATFNGVTTIPFTQTGTGAVTTTVDNKIKQIVSIKDFGAIGDGGTHPLSERYATLTAAQAVYPFVTSLTQTIDWAAIQAATNSIVSTSPNVGTVFIPTGNYITKDSIDCSSSSYSYLEYRGQGQTYIRNYSATPLATFDCSGATFKTAALKFTNFALWYPTNTSAGSIGVNLVNRQETYFDRMIISGYYNAIVLTDSYAPRVNTSKFQDNKGSAITATDASFKGASITNNTFFGNGIIANAPTLNLISPNGATITGNDFSTNYTHISFKYANGVMVTGNYFENTSTNTYRSFAFDGTSPGNNAIEIVGNTIQWSLGNVLQNVTGLNFSSNHLYAAVFTTDSTATRVRMAGNILETSSSPVVASSLSEPTYEVTLRPLISSSGVKTSDFQAIYSVLARPTNSAHGYIGLTSGNVSLPGYIAWYAPSNVRLGYMGYDATDIKLNLENSAKFIVSAGATQLNGGATVSTSLTVDGLLKLKAYTVATLSTCNGASVGSMVYVTDATAPTYNGTLTGGGAVVVPVFCDGTNWTSH